MGAAESKPTTEIDYNGDKPVLVYWLVHGRSDFCQAMMSAGSIDYDIDSDTANNYGSIKSELPFGQIPILKHKGLTLAQGGAITRYCARLAGLYPSDPAEASTCDMFMDEMMDIFSGLFKAKNAVDREAKLEAWKILETEHIPKHFSFLETSLEKSGQTYLGGSTPMAGDVAFFAVYNIYSKAGVDVESAINDCPKLKNALEETKLMGNLSSFPDHYLYFTSDPDHDSF